MARSRTHRHHGSLKTKSDIYAAYSNKTQAPEQIDYKIKALQKKADPQFRRTYSNGLALEEVVDSAPVFTVALEFLPGADKHQVNYIEQIDMEGLIADQKDAAWRVDTAGALLNNFTVSPDLQIVQTDQTANVLAKAKFQAHENDRTFPDQRKALILRKRYPDTVAIDSERVTMVKDLRMIIDHGFFSPGKHALKQSLEQVKEQLNLAEQSRMKVNLDEEVSNEPVAKCLYPEGTTLGESSVWNPYKAWCLEDNGYLHVEAKSATIQDVKWLTGELIELSLTCHPSRIFVTPLQAVPEGYRKDEVQVGETVVFLGHYIAVGEKDELYSHSDTALTMINYLRIVSVEDQSQSRRRRNRTQEFDDCSVTSFK